MSSRLTKTKKGGGGGGRGEYEDFHGRLIKERNSRSYFEILNKNELFKMRKPLEKFKIYYRI